MCYDWNQKRNHLVWIFTGKKSRQQISISGGFVSCRHLLPPDMTASFPSLDDANRILWVLMKYFIDHIMKNQWKSCPGCQFSATYYVCSDGFDCSPLWLRREYLGVPNYNSSERKFRRVILAPFIAFTLASERVAVPLLSDFTAARALMATMCNFDFSCPWDWINAFPSTFSKTIFHACWAAILVYTCSEMG